MPNQIPLIAGFARILEKLLPFPSQHHGTIVATKQRDTQLVLQLADIARQGRYADMALIAGTAKMQGLGQGEKLFQGFDIHSREHNG